MIAHEEAKHSPSIPCFALPQIWSPHGSLFEEDRRFELLKALTPYSLSKRAH
jgi:hypothetical protein